MQVTFPEFILGMKGLYWGDFYQFLQAQHFGSFDMERGRDLVTTGSPI